MNLPDRNLAMTKGAPFCAEALNILRERGLFLHSQNGRYDYRYVEPV